MKKKYCTPQTQSIAMEPATILCGSGDVVRFNGGGTSTGSITQPD